jgi:Arc/MetJ-type ribon-helix-helix transcriptional regulator
MSNKTTIGLKVSHERNARIERKVEDAGYGSRQSYIRELIDDDLGGFDTTVESATTQHTPDDRRDSEIYDALLDQIPLKGWTRFGRYKGDIAQSTGYPKDALFGELKSLRRNGFCTIRVLNPTDENPHYEIKVKPPAADPEQWTHHETENGPDLFGHGVPDDNETNVAKHHLLFAIEDGDEELIGEFDLQEFGLKRVEDEHDDRLVAPINETDPAIEDEVDRISHGTPDSHIETHVSRTSREEAVEDLRESEKLTNE